MYAPVASAMEGLFTTPELPAFTSSSSLTAYADYARPADTSGTEPAVIQNVYPSEKMSEENLANISARKITGALV